MYQVFWYCWIVISIISYTLCFDLYILVLNILCMKECCKFVWNVYDYIVLCFVYYVYELCIFQYYVVSLFELCMIYCIMFCILCVWIMYFSILCCKFGWIVYDLLHYVLYTICMNMCMINVFNFYNFLGEEDTNTFVFMY